MWNLDRAVPMPPLSSPPGWSGRQSLDGFVKEALPPSSCLGLWPVEVSWRVGGPSAVGGGAQEAEQHGLALTFLSSLPCPEPGTAGRQEDSCPAPARILKKELTPSFSASDGVVSGSGPACGQRLGLKQEDEPHVHIMKRRC